VIEELEEGASVERTSREKAGAAPSGIRWRSWS
jgi:hypothetical protein